MYNRIEEVWQHTYKDAISWKTHIPLNENVPTGTELFGKEWGEIIDCIEEQKYTSQEKYATFAAGGI